jgi:hypothetical protein
VKRQFQQKAKNQLSTVLRERGGKRNVLSFQCMLSPNRSVREVRGLSAKYLTLLPDAMAMRFPGSPNRSSFALFRELSEFDG